MIECTNNAAMVLFGMSLDKTHGNSIWTKLNLIPAWAAYEVRRCYYLKVSLLFSRMSTTHPIWQYLERPYHARLTIRLVLLVPSLRLLDVLLTYLPFNN